MCVMYLAVWEQLGGSKQLEVMNPASMDILVGYFPAAHEDNAKDMAHVQVPVTSNPYNPAL